MKTAYTATTEITDREHLLFSVISMLEGMVQFEGASLHATEADCKAAKAAIRRCIEEIKGVYLNGNDARHGP